MVMSLPSAENLKLHLILQQTPDGRSIATVLEFPEYCVEAPTDDEAIAQLQTLVTDRLANTKIVPLEISLPTLETENNPWVKYAGVFKDDPYFAKIMAAMQAERQVDDDEMGEEIA